MRVAEYEDRYYNSADGLRLHYRDYAGPSDQPPILCLPGLTRNARDFEEVAGRLAGTWRVICLEYRGRGESEKDPNPSRYMPMTYVGDVMKLLDQLGIADAVFFGTSLGGLVTMLIAGGGDEERIAGVMLNDIGPEVSPVGIERIRGYVGGGQQWSSWDDAAEAIGAVQRDIYPAYRHEDWLRFARRVCREEKPGRIVYDYDPAIALPFADTNPGTQPDLWPLLDALRGRPVTVLRGETSDLFTAQIAERMIAELGFQAELVTIPGVGHAPALDEPEAVAAIDRLLERVRVKV